MVFPTLPSLLHPQAPITNAFQQMRGQAKTGECVSVCGGGVTEIERERHQALTLQSIRKKYSSQTPITGSWPGVTPGQPGEQNGRHGLCFWNWVWKQFEEENVEMVGERG